MSVIRIPMYAAVKGDIIEAVKTSPNSHYIQGMLYQISYYSKPCGKQVGDISTVIDSVGSLSNGWADVNFNLVASLPGCFAEGGDNAICVETSSCHPYKLGEIFKVYATEGTEKRNGSLLVYDSKSRMIHSDDIRIIRSEDPRYISQGTRRNLAFYKRSGKPWTQVEYNQILAVTNNKSVQTLSPEKADRRFIFDDNTAGTFMYCWEQQENHKHFSSCAIVAYEDLFYNYNIHCVPAPSEPGFVSKDVIISILKERISTSKEYTMPSTLQALLSALFSGEKPVTDYEQRPTYLVVVYSRDGSELGTATADSIDTVKTRIANTPELWGCKVLTYKLDREVSVKVPVVSTKATTASGDLPGATPADTAE